ncbi:MAG: sigma 54-interacting transcriptional regulator [Blastocatellia bacterium]|nr:sigma 54-interacting transcriptional regulator [Blastocatellia bacterium]
MDQEIIQAITLSALQESELKPLVRNLVHRIANLTGIALVRIWLTGLGDHCSTCCFQKECPSQTRCLHLAASQGTTLAPGTADWSSLEGNHSRIPFQVQKIGYIGSTGSTIHLESLEGVPWITNPAWVNSEKITSFVGHPLIARGEIMGVLAIFARFPISKNQSTWLRTLADFVALAIANHQGHNHLKEQIVRLERENRHLQEELQDLQGYAELAGTSPALQKVRQQVEFVARTDSPALIIGEPGTGKELVARQLHRQSSRKDRSFIKINCEIAPAELLEKILFGSVGGQFQQNESSSRVQMADQGTLFLDEIGALPMSLQIMVNQLVQEGSIPARGNQPAQPVNVRIVAASRKNLRDEVQAGRFRADLYHRLSIFPIEIPPLRERPEDIPLLANFFIGRICQKNQFPQLTLSPEQVFALSHRSWAENVTELRSVVEQAVTLGRGEKLLFESGRSLVPSSSNKPEQPELPLESPPPTHSGENKIRRQERESIMAALRLTKGKIFGLGGAAEILGVKGTTLASRLKALGISKKEFRQTNG